MESSIEPKFLRRWEEAVGQLESVDPYTGLLEFKTFKLHLHHAMPLEGLKEAVGKKIALLRTDLSDRLFQLRVFEKCSNMNGGKNEKSKTKEEYQV